MEWHRDGYTITTDPARVDLTVVTTVLGSTYWAQGIPREAVAKSVSGSICFSLVHGSEQVGFARVISDHATFAYLADVFVVPEHRGKGNGRWLCECVMAHPELQGLRRWLLVTRDAHGLYRKLGFRELANPDRHMEKSSPNVYVGT